MELKKLKSIKQLINIYKLYHSSFPKEEKKPFLLILIGILKKRFEVFSIENETDGFIGLAIILKYNDLILLDFFSISSDIRSRGYGSKVLNLLKEYYKNYRFFLEIENPYDVKSLNLEERKKRQKFYIKNGFTPLPFRSNLFGVEMEILSYDCTLNFEEYHSLYINQFNGFMKNIISKNVVLVKI